MVRGTTNDDESISRIINCPRCNKQHRVAHKKRRIAQLAQRLTTGTPLQRTAPSCPCRWRAAQQTTTKSLRAATQTNETATQQTAASDRWRAPRAATLPDRTPPGRRRRWRAAQQTTTERIINCQTTHQSCAQIARSTNVDKLTPRGDTDSLGEPAPSFPRRWCAQQTTTKRLIDCHPAPSCPRR